MTFFLPEQRVLISGDTLVTRDLYNGRFGNPQLTRPRLNDNYDQARESLHRLKDLGEIHILPGHGRPWRGDIAEAIEMATMSGNSAVAPDLSGNGRTLS